MGKAKNVDVISMGCSKNLVDSERLLRQLDAKGYRLNHNPEKPTGDYVVVNTCGFINDAKVESIELLLGLGELKRRGKIGRIVVMGCLSQRYLGELKEEMPEVDRWYGKFDWKDFIESLPDLKGDGEKENSEETGSPREWERELTTTEGSCYLKISEGCNRFCSFCAIPLITGRHTSRPEEEILDEVRDLVSRGVKEFNVIAQDLSSYGLDLYGSHTLPRLIDRMASIPGVEWIRLHYAYPAEFPMELLEVMARHENVCKYIDIALQHISDPVLRNMRRHIDGRQTRELLAEMRRRVPGLKIRTTLMVGFPGEGEEEFRELLDFVKEAKFDRMGAFAYSEEEGTWGAENLEDSIPDDVKQQRLETLMGIQEEIAGELNEKMIGEEVRLIVDRRDGKYAVCRTQWDSPEVDYEVYLVETDLKPGDFVNARITDYDGISFEAERIVR